MRYWWTSVHPSHKPPNTNITSILTPPLAKETLPLVETFEITEIKRMCDSYRYYFISSNDINKCDNQYEMAWQASKNEESFLALLVSGCMNNTIVNYRLTLKRLFKDIKHFMPVNMTTYMKVLSNWQNRKSEWFNYIKEIELIFINLSTKKTLHQDSSPVNYHRTWRINNSNITQTLPGIEEKGKKHFSIMYEPPA